jgi:hypothetical protein
MNKRSPWYDPNTEKSRLLAALEQVWRLRNNSEEVVPLRSHTARLRGSASDQGSYQ